MPAASPFDRTLTGIPLWLLQKYLVQLGGQEEADGRLRGEGWQAQLTQVEDYQIGSLRVGQVRVEISGEAGAVDQVVKALEPKLLRAGG